MNIRIFRQPTISIQNDGLFYIDTLQVQHVHINTHVSTTGISGITSHTRNKGPWVDVDIVEADSYEKEVVSNE